MGPMLPTVLLSPLHLDPSVTSTVVAVGNFDGVHLGHAPLLARLVELARARGSHPLVYTFDPLPQEILRPLEQPTRLQAIDDRVCCLGEKGVEFVCLERFSRAYASHSARWFVEELLVRRLRAVGVVVGYDFRFGRDREGDTAFIHQVRPEMEVAEISAFADADGVISSSRIRAHVQSGDVEGAARLLGRPHRICGAVVMGDRRGRQIGFPTANVDISAGLVPARGVYAVRAQVDDGEVLLGVANIGSRPTFSGSDVRCEVHLLDVSIGPEALYGRSICVAFVARLRDEQRFASAADLFRGIVRDVRSARKVLERVT